MTACLARERAELVLNQPDIFLPLGVRDRAILEVFYSTGMRRSELAHLQLFDVDADRGTVMVRMGKGKKDRMIPIGERAVRWVERYLEDVRPFVGNEKIKMSLKPTGLTRDPTLLHFYKRFLNDFSNYDAFL